MALWRGALHKFGRVVGVNTRFEITELEELYEFEIPFTLHNFLPTSLKTRKLVNYERKPLHSSGILSPLVQSRWPMFSSTKVPKLRVQNGESRHDAIIWHY